MIENSGILWASGGKKVEVLVLRFRVSFKQLVECIRITNTLYSFKNLCVQDLIVRLHVYSSLSSVIVSSWLLHAIDAFDGASFNLRVLTININAQAAINFGLSVL